MKLVKQIIIFLGTFMLYHIVFSSFFPVDENNVLQAPDWYIYLGFGIATIAAIVFAGKKKSKQVDNSRSNADSLISYLRGASEEVPLDNTANTNVTSVEFKPKRPQIRTIWNPELDLMAIDQMEGHNFEYWCATLLKKIGFYNVEVTQGSGDQGVDVLAEKDGVRYAVQCKCYSKDLGNKPVQEVNSGKMMPEYHCQIGAVMTNRYFTKGAKDLAAATGTLLWDRDWIKSQLQISGSHQKNDALLEAIMDELFASEQSSTAHIQRKFNLDYQYAKFILQTLEEGEFVTRTNGGLSWKPNISHELWIAFKQSRNNQTQSTSGTLPQEL